MDRDALFDILITVDPPCLSNCILVCKDWSEVIKDAIFRQKYLALWKDYPRLVGFFMYEHIFIDNWRHYYSMEDACPQVQLLPTSQIGRKINEWKTMDGLGYFISKSLDNGLILSGVHPYKFYVSNPITGLRRRLPSPPYPQRYHHTCMANVQSDDHLDPSSFKVIIAHVSNSREARLIIHTYSSSTRNWVQSVFTHTTYFTLSPQATIGSGTLTKGGIIYWEASYLNGVNFLVVYDTNNARVSFIPEPPRGSDYEDVNYGVSPEGSLRCALTRNDTYNHKKAWDKGVIKIWGLHDTSRKDWNLLYEVDFESMWAENRAVLDTLFNETGKPERPFAFVSFVPGKEDSIYVGLSTEFFVYHFGTCRLERLSRAYEDGYGNPLDAFSSPVGGAIYYPVTMQELGVYYNLDRLDSWESIPRAKKCRLV